MMLPAVTFAAQTGLPGGAGSEAGSAGMIYAVLFFAGLPAAWWFWRRERREAAAGRRACLRVLAGAWKGPPALILLALVGLFYILGMQLALQTGLSADPSSDPEQFGRAIMIQTLFMQWLPLMAFFFLRFRVPEATGRGRKQTRLSGWVIMQRSLHLYLASIPLLVVVSALYFGLNRLLGREITQQSLLTVLGSIRSPWVMAYLTFVVVLLGPLVEELLFRRVWLPTAARYLGMVPAVILVSFAFALLHGHVDSLAALFLMGVVFSLAYLRTASLLAAVIVHATFNAVNLGLLLFVQ